MWDDNHWPEYYWDDNHWPGVVVVVVRRVIKWYGSIYPRQTWDASIAPTISQDERLRPRISWIMRGTPCQ